MAETMQRQSLTALADVYGRTLSGLGVVLVAHRPDERWSCVACSIRRRHRWKECVHADAARVAARRLAPRDFQKLITPAYQPPRIVRGVQRALASIEAETGC